jgi:hypothetical protein
MRSGSTSTVLMVGSGFAPESAPSLDRLAAPAVLAVLVVDPFEPERRSGSRTPTGSESVRTRKAER